MSTAAQSEVAQRAADTGREKEEIIIIEEQQKQQNTLLLIIIQMKFKLMIIKIKKGKMTKFYVIFRCNIDIVWMERLFSRPISFSFFNPIDGPVTTLQLFFYALATWPRRCRFG